jgi:mannan endo-1,4-beta-mannosidase
MRGGFSMRPPDDAFRRRESKSNRLICMFEVHSTTGYGDQSAATLSQAADYWLNIRSALNGQERYVLINIGNEPYGNTNTAGWTNDTINAIRKIRNGGMTHTLVVDGPNWGQDWSGVMRINYGQASMITSYLNAYVNAGLPIIIGEFGNTHSDGNGDTYTIMATAQSKGLSYLGWSWSGPASGSGGPPAWPTRAGRTSPPRPPPSSASSPLPPGSGRGCRRSCPAPPHW